MHKLIMSSLALSLLAGVSTGALAQEPAAGDVTDDMPEAADERGAEAVDPALPAAPETDVAPPAIPEAVEIPPQQPSADAPAEVVLPDEMIGKTVYDIEENELGTVTGFAINDAGQPNAVVEFGGFLGLGTKEVAVPVDLFSPGDQGSLIVNLTEEELDEMHEIAERQADGEGEGDT